MKSPSIFNHVLGPVMRGPSSSHTAGAYHIGRMARSMLAEPPRRAVVAFDPAGSYAQTYAAQGADRALAMGLMNRRLTDESFFTAIDDAAAEGLELRYEVRPLQRPDHPNSLEIELVGQGDATLRLAGRSIGGGEVEITHIDDRPVLFRGTAHEVLVETSCDQASDTVALLGADGALLDEPRTTQHNGRTLIEARRAKGLSAQQLAAIAAIDRAAPGSRVFQSSPVYFVQTGRPLFASAAEMVSLAHERRCSLGSLALAYEAELLGLGQAEVIAEMLRRYDVMLRAAEQGLALDFSGLQLLPACAGAIYQAEAAGRLSVRSLHTRAAARAMAVMHVDGAMGVVCAAPTGGSAGTLPGAVITLAEERRLDREQIALALLAAGAVGLIIAQRATFAAEIAGCQVEIGAAGAMAAAAVVDAVGGSAAQAADAAAVALQNTMGSVCDLLHGTVEIPCHTRNAAAAAGAFVVADLVLGGYPNLIPLDETIDAMLAVGRAMPAELRCTSRGGLAVTPSALSLRPGGCGKEGCGKEPCR